MTNEQLVAVLGVIRNSKNQVLIAKRHDTETVGADDKWELVGGQVEFGESPEQALLREIKEETNLDVEIIRLIPMVESQVWSRHNGEKYQVFLIPYECKTVDDSQLKQNIIDEVQNAKFVDIKDIGQYNFLPFDEELIKTLI